MSLFSIFKMDVFAILDFQIFKFSVANWTETTNACHEPLLYDEVHAYVQEFPHFRGRIWAISNTK